LLTVGAFRCLSATQLAELAPMRLRRRALLALIAELQAARLLAPYRIPGTSRTVHHLTRRAVKAVPELAVRYTTATAGMTPDVALWGWQRAEVHRRLRLEGWTVGRDLAALAALRRHLLDHASTPALRDALARALVDPTGSSGRRLWHPFRCPCGLVSESSAAHARPTKHNEPPQPCDGTPRLSEPLLYDVVYRDEADAAPFLLLVDNPNRALLPQLNELPLRTALYDSARRGMVYQPALELLYLPPDDGSVWDNATASWAQRGPRLRQLALYVSARPDRRLRSGSGASHFPFLRTVTLRPPMRGLYLNQLRSVAAQRSFAYA
jgi:hypothetical protein